MSSGAFLLLLLVTTSVTALSLKKTDGGLSRLKRTANHVVKDCIHMTSEEGHYFYKSAGEDATVCGIYFVTAPNMLVQVHFDYLDVPCATGGLLAFVDGWELNGGYFPAVEEHELPLSERVSEFCGLTPPSRTFLSSQNAALLQYRYCISGKSASGKPCENLLNILKTTSCNSDGTYSCLPSTGAFTLHRTLQY